jgi:dTMP kinase
MEMIRKINEEFAPRPHLLFFIELDPKTAIRRIKEKRGEMPNSFEGKDYLEKVDSIFKKFPDSFIERLDGSLPEENLIKAAIEKVRSILKEDPSFP